MSDRRKKVLESVKEILQSIYFLVWLLITFASIIPQLYPIVFHPIVIEGARYTTLILISLFGSYVLLKRSEKKTKGFKGAIGETEKKIEELKVKTESSFHEIDRKIAEFSNFKIDQDGKHQDLDKKISQFINEISKVNALSLKNQQTLLTLGERLDKFFFIKCPICKKRIDLDIPNTIISGIHEVDGRASDRTSRGTKELDLQCPQCRRNFHIDIPHSELVKI